MITLRTNQTEPIKTAIRFFKAPTAAPSLIVLPTAWGKSILTAYVAKYCNDNIIVLQPTKELLEQNYTKYASLCGGIGVDCAVYSAAMGEKRIAKITYATIGSIKNIGSTFRKQGFTKMLIDEAHLFPRETDSMLGKFLHDSGITHVLGITATPIKLQTYMHLDGTRYSKLVMLTTRSKKGNFYRDIIAVGQIQEMIQLGFWTPLKYITEEFDETKLQTNTAGSDFTEQSVRRAFYSHRLGNVITRMVNKMQDRKHILVFAPSVEQAAEIVAQTPAAAIVHGEMNKKERENVIRQFKHGQLRILVNVNVLTAGFDCVDIDCIILARATMSIALYYQMIGRATRISPNKKDAVIVDLMGNVRRFGKVEDITFTHEKRWTMRGSGGKQLSDIPLNTLNPQQNKPTQKERYWGYQQKHRR